MKKICCFILILILVTVICSGELLQGDGVARAEETVIHSISQKIIRFHVIANSDTVQDQNLKAEVRDSVLQYITPLLENSKTIEESREIINKNDQAIKTIAEKAVKSRGYKYSIATVLSVEKFPVKAYGAMVLPQGDYEAYRIIIGNGSGQNWWCVMFPPLCFIDITKGEVAEKETETAMKTVLNKDEYKVVNSKPQAKEIKIKFKAAEVFKGIVKKIKV